MTIFVNIFVSKKKCFKCQEIASEDSIGHHGAEENSKWFQIALMNDCANCGWFSNHALTHIPIVPVDLFIKCCT